MPFHTERDIAFFNQLSKGFLPEYLGIQVTKVEENYLEAVFELKKQLFAPNGYVHAGSLVSLADTLAGYACVSHLPEKAISFTTIELKSNFLGTAKEGNVIAQARPEHLGKTSQVWDVIVKSELSGKNMALFRCTQLIIYPTQ